MNQEDSIFRVDIQKVAKGLSSDLCEDSAEVDIFELYIGNKCSDAIRRQILLFLHLLSIFYSSNIQIVFLEDFVETSSPLEFFACALEY